MVQIKHGKVKVDGYDPSTKTVYEFQGCDYHGCKKCKPNNRHAKSFHHPDRTLQELYQVTQRKIELLKKAGYSVVEKWECDFRNELKQNEHLQTVISNMSWVFPLDPREAFYGGRTGMAKCHYPAEENERILYEDFTSLYPWVNKHATYPVGHPQIIVSPTDQNIGSYFGIAKVDVLAPEKLLHPGLTCEVQWKIVVPSVCKVCRGTDRTTLV